ncbi:MAG: PDZ domain-containing protein [Thermoguttaceae bacterium]|nr:PDZ domain-containing protein [Thermoguttaceae bacterium]MDW8079026.1 PDZ domain-containing protein [Thermoguttaceae bacterium]
MSYSSPGQVEPQTEQGDIYVDIFRLHYLFALGAVGLLVATVALLVVDHNRPWKKYQLQYREEIRPWLDKITQFGAEIDRHLSASLSPSKFQPPRRPPAWLRWLYGGPFFEPFLRRVSVEEIRPAGIRLDLHFGTADRIDRCITCHQGMAPSNVGWPWQVDVQKERFVHVRLSGPTGKLAEASRTDSPQASTLAAAIPEDRLAAVTGIFLARGHLCGRTEVLVVAVREGSLADRAGLLPGDRLLRVGQTKPTEPAEAATIILSELERQGTLELLVRRGLPHPFAAHPRPDLFISPDSPHPVDKFGCTICHWGQGAATSFENAGHYRLEILGAKTARRARNWSSGKEWPWPMRPVGLGEASCGQCHHQPEELVHSAWEGETTGTLWLKGYQTVLRLGCYGCHEIAGLDQAGRQVGPELRLERPYHELAGLLLAHPALTDELRCAAELVRNAPWNVPARWALAESLEKLINPGKLDESSANSSRNSGAETRPPRLLPEAAGSSSGLSDQLRRIVVDLRREDLSAGSGLPKVGPSLRHAGQKLSADFVAAFLWDPQSYSAESKMPRVFGLYDHLSSSQREGAEGLELAEIVAITFYLTGRLPSDANRAARSSLSKQAAPGANPGAQELQPGDSTRGEAYFVRQGCIACHRHERFPEASPTIGPDLSRLGEKLDEGQGPQWLRGWLSNPAALSPRTNMPRLLFKVWSSPNGDSPSPNRNYSSESPTPPAPRAPQSPAVDTDLTPEEVVIADLVAFLLQPTKTRLKPPPLPSEEMSREALRLYLREVFPPQEADRFLLEAVPEEQLAQLGTDERDFLGHPGQEARTLYLARKAMRRHGCAGCHEIPGLELANPIGPSLTGWGDKWPQALDFGEEALKSRIWDEVVTGGTSRLDVYRDDQSRAVSFSEPNSTSLSQKNGIAGLGREEGVEGSPRPGEAPHNPSKDGATESASAPNATSPSTESNLAAAFIEGRREGLLWLKLRHPRAFDFTRAERKPFTQWLRMPQFRWRDDELLAVMTFVLGLSGRALPEEVRPKTPEEGERVAQGMRLLERLGCSQCHVLDWERIVVEYDPARLPTPPPPETFPWLRPRLKPGDSWPPHPSGPALPAELWGMVERDTQSRPIEELGDDEPQFFVTPWRPEPVWVEGAWHFWEPGAGQVPMVDSLSIVARALDSARENTPLGPPPWEIAPVDPSWLRRGGSLRLSAQERFKRIFDRRMPSQSGLSSHRPGDGIPGGQALDSPFPAQKANGLLARLPEPPDIPRVIAARGAVGGHFPWLLVPVLGEELTATAADLWNLLPPPLIHQAERTGRTWTANYIRDPYPIRPSVVLNMPRYHISPEEADALAACLEFLSTRRRARGLIWEMDESLQAAGAPIDAALSLTRNVLLEGNQQSPIQGAATGDQSHQASFSPSQSPASPPEEDQDSLARLDRLERELGAGNLSEGFDQLFQRRLQAFRLIVDRQVFCGKCHLVGDRSPSKLSAIALGPRLDEVAGRLRPSYLRRWIADPRRYVPYTAMPVNFPPTGPPIGQDLLPGPPEAQIEAVVDLLTNYPAFLREWWRRSKMGLEVAP